MTTHPEVHLTQKMLEDLSAKLPAVAAELDDQRDRDLLRECFLRGADAYLDDAKAKPVPVIATFTLGGGRGGGNDWSIGDYRGKEKKPRKPPEKPPEDPPEKPSENPPKPLQ